MTERSGEVDVDYESDVEIDFSELDNEEKLDLIEAILNGNIFTFKEVSLNFNGEVTIDVEPLSANWF